MIAGSRGREPKIELKLSHSQHSSVTERAVDVPIVEPQMGELSLQLGNVVALQGNTRLALIGQHAVTELELGLVEGSFGFDADDSIYDKSASLLKGPDRRVDVIVEDCRIQDSIGCQIRNGNAGA